MYCSNYLFVITYQLFKKGFSLLVTLMCCMWLDETLLYKVNNYMIHTFF